MMETAVVNVVSEYNNGLIKTQLMKYSLTTGRVHAHTVRITLKQEKKLQLVKFIQALSPDFLSSGTL